MEVKMEVMRYAQGVKMDNTYSRNMVVGGYICAQTIVLFNSHFNSNFNSNKNDSKSIVLFNSNFNSKFNSLFNSNKKSNSDKQNMNNSRTFKDLECWQKAHEFVKAVYAVTKHFPEDERYGLTSQFRRAAVSIAANICEGYKKLSKADKLRFMNIAQGSLEECRYYIILALDINYIDRKTHDELEYLINGASWKLNGYAEGITKNSGIGD